MLRGFTELYIHFTWMARDFIEEERGTFNPVAAAVLLGIVIIAVIILLIVLRTVTTNLIEDIYCIL